jgi:hypothetical protein
VKEYAHQPFVPLDPADLPQFALGRLRRFTRIAGLAGQLTTPPWRRLACQAVYVAYCDCLSLGLKEQAEEVLRQGRQAQARAALRTVELELAEDSVAVQGEYVMAVVETTLVGRQILARNGVRAGTIDAWYPRMLLVEALREMESAGLSARLRACGVHAALKLRTRAEEQRVGSLGQFLALQGEHYLAMHRGEQPSTVTAIVQAKASGGRATVTCRDPYPCDFWLGWFEGLGTSFGRAVKIGHRGGACKSSGQSACVYRLSW